MKIKFFTRKKEFCYDSLKVETSKEVFTSSRIKVNIMTPGFKCGGLKNKVTIEKINDLEVVT